MAARVQEDGSLVVRHLPLAVGEEVEIIVLVQEAPGKAGERYPLRGLPLEYDRPTEPVAESEWDADR
jgi:hypothetical protein